MNNKIEELASLILDFGKIDRITYHQDGLLPESDTDHTVMIGVLGLSIASKLYKDLDLGLIAQFALVHDLVEVHAGDTPTLVGVTTDSAREKENRERHALDKIKEDFGEEFNWIHETIEKYERLDTKEARFVKTLDKILPKITVVLNKAKAVNDKKFGAKDSVRQNQQKQIEHLRSISFDMPELLEIWEYFNSKQLEFIID